MPFDECSAAMGFQVGFKGVCFFFVFKGNRILDTPWSEFRCMRHIAFIVFFKAGVLILQNSSLKLKMVADNAILRNYAVSSENISESIKIKTENGFHLKVNVCKFR